MKLTHLAAVSIIAVAASGCVGADLGTIGAPAPSAAPLRADVNPGYNAGSFGRQGENPKGLSEILAKDVHKPEKIEDQDEGDKLRAPAMQETALAYGAQAGLAHETSLINRRLESQSSELTRIYDFQSLMIQGPNNTMVLPPIISEAVDAWEAFDAGKTLRVADTVYEIIEQARFSPVAPMWQNYLVSRFDDAQAPPEALLPQSQGEKEAWNGWIREGWSKGREQAHEIFQANLDRLNRDFTGMVRYRELLEEKKVSAPILAVGNLGTTGTGQDMRVNDQAIRMTREPTLRVEATDWDSSVTTKGEDGQSKGAERPRATVSKTPETVSEPAEKASLPVRAPKPAAKAKPMEKTNGGDGRF